MMSSWKIRATSGFLLACTLFTSVMFDFTYSDDSATPVTIDGIDCGIPQYETFLPLLNIKNTSKTHQNSPNFNSRREVDKIYTHELKIQNKAILEHCDGIPENDSLLSEIDNLYLVKIASCEAGDQGVYGMALVMQVVLNRAQQYDMSIRDVIYAPEQFACIHDDLWLNNYINPDAYHSLDLINSGWDESNGALYFCTHKNNGWHSSHLTYLFTYMSHEFYR